MKCSQCVNASLIKLFEIYNSAVKEVLEYKKNKKESTCII